MVRAVVVVVVVVADLALLAARFPSITRKSQTFFNLIARGDLDLRLAEPEDDMSDDELARLNEALARFRTDHLREIVVARASTDPETMVVDEFPRCVTLLENTRSAALKDARAVRRVVMKTKHVVYYVHDSARSVAT